MNKAAIQKVKEGKASIEHTRKNADLDKVNAVIRECFDSSATGKHKYYFVDKESEDGWNYSNTNPAGLTPISLDDFFEEYNGMAYIGAVFQKMTDHAKGATPKQPPLPSGVQTMEEIPLYTKTQLREAMKHAAWNAENTKIEQYINDVATPPLPPSEEKGVEEAAQWFDNNSDCYAMKFTQDGCSEDVSALTKEKFIEWAATQLQQTNP